MAFGLKRAELTAWKHAVQNGEIGIITHYWQDERFPTSTSVTKVGCADLNKLVRWGRQYGLKAEWIDNRSPYPHFDLFAETQLEVLRKEGLANQINRFNLN
ncbi:hypothetical protein SAMN04488134_101192 [Amphibacillus marinus]|uniref:YneQ n=1 Tax=Amphibacillus marinus TaxID=872970 RepID=A0A1H8GZ43_9BACI|nr:hypothetical protein [Amphibacillus marinus]SEN48508.1 hypothetical protein SAMN04488134_101192 [Amphibacillus marinus]